MVRMAGGLLLGVLVGAPLGFVLYLVLRETVIPYALWSSDLVMWAVIAATAAAASVLAVRRGGKAAAFGGNGWRMLGGIGVGMVSGGVVTTCVAIAAAVVFDISQMEGAYAMGVAFVWAPLGALIGAVSGAVFAARRGR